MKIKHKGLFFLIVILTPIVGYIVVQDYDIWDFILYVIAGIIGATFVERLLNLKYLKINNELVDLVSKDLVEPTSQEQQVVVDKKWRRKILWILTGNISALFVVLMSVIAIFLGVMNDDSVTGNRNFDFVAIPCMLLVSFWLLKSIKSSWTLQKEAAIKSAGLNWKCPNCGSQNDVTIKICPYCRA